MTKREAPEASVETLSDAVILDTMPRAVIVAGPDGRIVRWNPAATELFGWTADDTIGRRTEDFLIPAQEVPNASEARARIAAGETLTGDFTLMHRDGHAIRARVANRAVLDGDGVPLGVLGVSEDVSEQRLAEQQSADLAEQLRVALDVGGLGTWHWDLATGQTAWDTKLGQLYGLRPGMLSGTIDQWYASIHRDDRAEVVAALEHAVETKSGYEVEHRVIWPDGSIHWLQGKGQMVVDEHGRVLGAIGCSSDVTHQVEFATERERVAAISIAAAETERLARERLEFLSTINDALSGSPTRHEAMRSVTQALVPRLGEWCTMYVLPDTGSLIPEVEAAHADPEQLGFANHLKARFPYDPHSNAMIPRIIRSGQGEFYPVLDREMIAAAAPSDEARTVVPALSLRSVIAVPLTKAGRVLGAMQFVNTENTRVFTNDDVVLAEIIAGRIASALDNLRLREHEQMIATTLQASLLPDSLPVVDGVEVAVRYWATGEGTEVGGDFYDMFELDGSWAVVMGDVCGTGPIAASTTGLARHTIRASAWHGASAPDVLSELNHAMLRSGRSTFCTVAYSTLTPAGRGFDLEVTSGGHPLPIVHRASGQIELAGHAGTLVGMLDQVAVVPITTRLEPGDAVVMYTDGITDVRPPHDIDASVLQRLVAESCADGVDADTIADRLRARIEAVLPLAERNDDIALLVLRVSD